MLQTLNILLPQSRLNLLIISGVLTVMIFAFDLFLPLGIAGGVPYVVIVLLTISVSDRTWTYAAGGVGTSLTVAGYFLSPEVGAIDWMVITNRLLAVFGIWMAVFFMIQYQKVHSAQQQEKEFINTILQTTKNLLVVMDPKGGVIRCNQTLSNLVGEEPATLEGKQVSHVLKQSEFGRQLLPDPVPAVFPSQFYDTLTTEAGEERQIVWQNGAILNDKKDEVQYIVASGSDITELQEARSSLETINAQLKQSNEELEQFAHVISHDLKEPLRMVSSYLELLKKRYRNQLDADAVEFLNFAVDGSQRMQQLIHDLLRYSRVDTRGSTFQPVDLNEVTQKVTQNLSTHIRELEAQVSTDSLPTVHADETQMIQLYQNLVENALKFRDQDSPEICLMAKEEPRQWKLAVQDNGIGLPDDQQKKLFQIFKRFHTDEEYQGTGIGLAICQRIIQRHNGQIWFESIKGEGTTVYFTLPK